MTITISTFIPENTPVITDGGFKVCTFGTLNVEGKTYSVAALSRRQDRKSERCNELFEIEVSNVRLINEKFPKSRHFAELVHIENETLFFIRCQFNASELVKGKLNPITSEPFSWELRKTIARDAIEAVNLLHINGFIHRDIKPDNVLVDNDGHARLCDQQFLCKQDHPHSKKIVGTIPYQSPDTIDSIARGNNFRSYFVSVIENDIWTTGLTAQLILQGHSYWWLNDAIDLSDNSASSGDYYAMHRDQEDFCIEESINFLKLVSFNPENRPSLETALQHFDEEVAKLTPPEE